MNDLSLHILDIALNSTKANAAKITISIFDSDKNDILSIVIEDNGKGIPPEMLKNIDDPFTTSRTTRKVGMGIPLFKMAALDSEGSFNIESTLNKGTTVAASFKKSCVNCLPLGDIGETFATLISNAPNVNFVLIYKTDEDEIVLDTNEY